MGYLKKLVAIICLVFNLQYLHAQVGINTIEPKSTLDINGNLSLKTIGIPTALNGGPSGSATAINDGVYISLTPLSGAPEFYIPNAATVPGRIYIFRNISTSVTAQIYAVGPSLFFAKDSATTTGGVLNLPPTGILKTAIVISDGQNWTYLF